MMGPMEPTSRDAWAVPGSVAEPAAAPPPLPRLGASSPDATAAGGGPGGGPWAPAAGPLDEAAAEVPQIKLRPMTVADIVDGAFTIIKARPARILGISAILVVPLTLLVAYLERALYDVTVSDMFSSDPAVVAEASEDSAVQQNLLLVMELLLPALALVAVASAIAQLARGWSHGYDTPAGELLRGMARKAWPLFASYLLVHAAEAVGGAACLVGALFVMPLFVVTAPVIGMEDAGPIEAMKRSWKLAGKRYWPVLGVSLLIGLVAWLLSVALGGLPAVLASVFGLDIGWLLIAVGNVLGAVVTTPFVAAATVLLYLDLRVRLEGIDLEMTARDVLDDVAPTA
jgi:hypothetical protein